MSLSTARRTSLMSVAIMLPGDATPLLRNTNTPQQLTRPP
jgi:hypothetical protein